MARPTSAKLRRSHIQRKVLAGQLATLTNRPNRHVTNDPGLLDQLPLVEANLARLPEEIERELFDAFQLQIRYYQPTRRVTIDGETIPKITNATQKIMRRTKPPRVHHQDAKQAPDRCCPGPRSRSLAVCAPGAIRTPAHGSGGRFILPPVSTPDLRERH
jgi:site-specific DNA recombinase